MAAVLKGMEAVNGIKGDLSNRVDTLKSAGKMPCLGIVRIGARQDDLAYERGAVKRCEGVGVLCKVFEFPETIDNEAFLEEFKKINDDETIHGLLVFQPMPRHIDTEAVKCMIRPEKDIDCMSQQSLAKVFVGDGSGYAPCTPSAVVEMLRYFKIPMKGKRVVIVGRSMVVGKPLSMMLLRENATVTICHTGTVNLEEECRRAEILIAAAGKAKMINADHVAPGAVVIDVGINVDENGNLCGDVDFESVEPVAGAVSPVPGGVGSVTSSILALHTIDACERA